MNDFERNNPSDALSENVRQLREIRGLSQGDLADKVGVHRTYIGGIERGEKAPALDKIGKIAGALNVPPKALLSSPDEVLDGVSPEQTQDPEVNIDGGTNPPSSTIDSSVPDGKLSQYLEASADRSIGEENDGELVEPQPVNKVRKILFEHLSKRGVANNRLAGKAEGEEEGVILLPPYECDVNKNGDAVSITIRGSNGDPNDTVWDGDMSWSTTCERVVASRYRGNALIFYRDSGNRPERDVLVPIQESRVQMLKSVPPGESLKKVDFLHHENNLKGNGKPQSDAPRRWRELRSEFGFDVWEEGGRYYRSETIPPVEKPNRRPDMSDLKSKYWDELYEHHDGKCNICGRDVRYDDDDDGLYGLLDHRVPVLYGGSDEKSNLQVACQECNNIKKKRYQRDPEQYLSENLALAYPEKFERFFVQLSSEEGEMLRALSQEREVPVRKFAGNLLGAATRMLADQNGR